MIEKDAVHFVMGFVAGAAWIGSKQRDKTFVNKAMKRALKTLKGRQAGFFNALERIVEEELRRVGFDSEPN